MKAINSDIELEKALHLISELLVKTEGIEDANNSDYKELLRISDLVEVYEDIHHPIKSPSLIDVIKLRMYEMGLNQSDLAQLLEVPKTRISEYLRGKREITLSVAKKTTLQIKYRQ